MHRFAGQAFGVAAEAGEFVEDGEHHHSAAHFFVDVGVWVAVAAEESALEVALALKHQYAGGDEIVLAGAEKRIGKIENAAYL